ncbi:MAG TPA: hypothetical protein VNA69_11875 [Thermoanaerobaculia bacterium]|nr:hypothetical protein [Thermoanaerobaculia bacterium]
MAEPEITTGTSDETVLAAKAAIGSAVLASQMLEVLFALCVRLAFGQRNVGSARELTPLEKNFSMLPVRAMLKQLQQHVDVSPEFESRLEDLVERRHTLIHRWGIENTFPTSTEDYIRMAAFSLQIAVDSNALSRLFHGYVVEWMERVPELAAKLNGRERVWLASPPTPFDSVRIEK